MPTDALCFELLDKHARNSRPKPRKQHPDSHPDVEVTPAEPVQSPLEVMLARVVDDVDEESVDVSDDSDSAGDPAFDIRRFEYTTGEDEDELESAPEFPQPRPQPTRRESADPENRATIPCAAGTGGVGE